MDQFKKDKNICFEDRSPESYKKALREYRELLKNNLAFKDEDFFSFFDVEFINQDGSKLKEDDIESKEIRKYFDAYFEYAESKSYISEEIFFACALEQEELKEDIIETAKEITALARRINDTNDMWVDDFNVFGLGALYMIANIYPEYSYLMGAYMIPYWDDEHAPYAQELIIDYTMKREICRETLKLFCYCDNNYVRYKLFGDRYRWNYEIEDYERKSDFVELKDWFRENKEEYEWFKETLKERFKEYDYLQYSESSFEPHPIDEFYKSMVDDHDFSKIFVYDNADIEASELEKEIISWLGKELVEEPVEEEEDYYSGEGMEVWKEFIENEFRTGREIWDYIESGGNSSILDTIPPVESKELYNLISNSNYRLKKTVTYFVGKLDSLEEELSRVVSEIFYDYYNKYERLELDNIEESRKGNAKLIRFMDFLYALFGKREFHNDFVEFVVEEYELMTEEEFYNRYSKNLKERVKKIATDFLEFDSPVYRSELEKVYKNFKDLRDEDSESAAELAESFFFYKNFEFDFDQADYNLKWIVFLMYILGKDMEENRKDLLTEKILNFVDTQLLPEILKTIKRYSCKDGEIEKVEEILFYKPKMPPKELMMKVMKVGINELTPEEREEFEEFKNQKKPESTDICSLLENMLSREKFKRSKGYFYDVLRSDNIKLFLQGIYLLSQSAYNSFRSIVKVENLNKLEMIMAAFINMAPIKTINTLSKLWRVQNDDFIDEHLGKIDFMDSFKKFKIDEEKVIAWEIHYVLNSREEKEFDRVVDILGDIDEEEESGFLGSIAKKKREKTYEALEYIGIKNRLSILEAVEKKYGVKTSKDELLKNLLKAYLGASLMREENINYLINSKKDVIYDGRIADYKGDKFGLAGIGLSKEEISDKFDYSIMAPYVLLISKTEEEYKTAGDQFLIDVFNDKEKYDGYYFNTSRVLIVAGSLEEIKKEEIIAELMEYVQGQLKFEEVEAYLEYFKLGRFNSEEELSLEELIDSFEEEEKFRLMRLYIHAGKEIDRYFAERIEGNLEELQKFIDFYHTLNLPIDTFAVEIIENAIEEEVEFLGRSVNIAELIKKQRAGERIKILERFGETEDLRKYLEFFKDDESRNVRDLVEEYL